MRGGSQFFKQRRGLTAGMILLVFALITGVTIAQAHTGQIVGLSDFIYHMNRIETFKQAIEAHQWFTFRSFTTFNQIGVANNYFYPYVFIWLWAWPYVWFNPVTAYYLNVAILMMMTLLITYGCTYLLTKSRLESLLVAATFATTPYHTFILGNAVLGEVIAYAFIPLYFLAVGALIKAPRRYWWGIAVALALTAYAHVITLALEIGLLIIVYLVVLATNKTGRWQRILAGFKAAGLFVLLTAFFWVPFIRQFSRTTIQPTVTISQVQWLSDFGGLITAMLTNGAAKGVSPNPGLFSLLAVVGLLLAWRQLPSAERWLGIIGLSLLVGSTSLLPWYALSKTLQNVIQFPYRLYGLASFALLVVGSRAVSLLIQRWQQPAQRQLTRRWVICGLILSCGLFYVSMIKNDNQTHGRVAYTSAAPRNLKHAFAVNFRLDNRNYATLFSAPRQFFGTIDYAPKVTWQGNHQQTLITHQVLAGKRHLASRHQQTVEQITYRFTSERAQLVDVPVLHYGSEIVRVNGQRVTAQQSQRGSTLILAHRGKNVVTISEPISVTFKALVLVAVGTWLGLAGYLGHRQFRKY